MKIFLVENLSRTYESYENLLNQFTTVESQSDKIILS